MFINNDSISGTWQGFERLVCRYLVYRGYEGVRLVGSSSDKGADVIAHKNGKRWLFQVKRWKAKVGVNEIDETLGALRHYRADIPAIVAKSGFNSAAYKRWRDLMAHKIPLQLWDGQYLIHEAGKHIKESSHPPEASLQHEPRQYQESAVRLLLQAFDDTHSNQALVVMATGLGKTRVVCEFMRRAASRSPIKALVLAHTNELVYQLEKAFWNCLQAKQETIVWNGYEQHDSADLGRADFVFACVDTVANYIRNGGTLPEFDAVFVDECHHVGETGMYQQVFESVGAGLLSGAFLIGVTATPWRPNDANLSGIFGDPLVSIDLATGMKKGFLANVDYRMYTTNIDWKKINKSANIKGVRKLSPKQINKTLFVMEWDDGVIKEIQKAWNEQVTPRALVFCGSVKHAIAMKDRINAAQFCRAESLFSQGVGGERMAMYERNRILSDFHSGSVQVICCVDIFNEGIDVPDVNIVVFQRVTHSRRIFIQQLGRGLRLAPDKEKVIVLDFVSDVRRLAAGISLQNALSEPLVDSRGREVHVRFNHSVSFYRYGEIDPRAESFLHEWLRDVSEIEGAGEDTAILNYPPPLNWV